MGTTQADFHSVRNIPEERDRLNTFARGEAMLSAVALSIYADIPSTPFAFFTLRHFFTKLHQETLYIHVEYQSALCRTYPQLEGVEMCSSM